MASVGGGRAELVFLCDGLGRGNHGVGVEGEERDELNDQDARERHGRRREGHTENKVREAKREQEQARAHRVGEGSLLASFDQSMSERRSCDA